MAENKNALVNETANENGNAAITERLDNVAERIVDLDQQSEQQRRAQAAEMAKSVADRRAAVLDYTENYRENQKIAKAARTTVTKAKKERLQ